VEAKTIADITMAICTGAYAVGVFSQVARVYKLKSAIEISWAFLVVTWMAITAMGLSKLLIQCYFAAFMDLVQLVGFTSLLVMKIVFERRKNE